MGQEDVKKKHLKSFTWLRNIKIKKYSKLRFDTFFSDSKYTSLKIVLDGGWHFSQLKSPEDIQAKLTNSEDHYEYKLTNKKLSDIEDFVKRKVIIYDHKAKTSEYKFSKEFKLKTLPIKEMPLFLQKSVDKYLEWFDFEK